MRFLFYIQLIAVLIAGGMQVAGAAGKESEFKTLAVLLAKGWFPDHVARNASVAECVDFLNKHGICFSIFDLMNPAAKVTYEDLARVAGQAAILFEGEAVIERGCIKKPKEMKTWVDYCLLNDIEINEIWKKFQLNVDVK